MTPNGRRLVPAGTVGKHVARSPRQRNAEPSSALETQIRVGLRKHLRQLGFRRLRDGTLRPIDQSKAGFRLAHSARRAERITKEREFIDRSWPKLRSYFANGAEVAPELIQPTLELVHAGTWQADLFRLAALTWSVPVSQGYGRRLRFLVWDKFNGKLLGLIALGDPVFNLRVRERAIGWSTRYRTSRLVNVMDAYVLGAIPPYNQLLGGKLVACLVKSAEVKAEFDKKYSSKRGTISKRRKRASLVLVTTTSALGKSAMLDRLKIGRRYYFKSVGYTQGWGHFHLPDSLFGLMRDYLKVKEHRYASGHRFGQGPNWKLRVARQALSMIGINDNVLSHGIAREVFLCWVASNGRDVLTRQQPPAANFSELATVAQVSAQVKERWIIPRAKRRPEFASWTNDKISVLLGQPGQETLQLANGVRHQSVEAALAAS